MAGFDYQQMAVAKLYSGAMLKLAQNKGQADSLLEELQGLAAYLDGDRDFDIFLASPMVDAEVREKVLEKAFRGRASDLLVDSLQIINRKGRSDILRAIVEAYRLAHQERRGIIDVYIKTAVPLTDALRTRIHEAVRHYCQKEARLSETVDASLLGGLVLQIGDQKIDTSMARELANFKEKLLLRASQEIQTRRDAYFSELES